MAQGRIAVHESLRLPKETPLNRAARSSDGIVLQHPRGRHDASTVASVRVLVLSSVFPSITRPSFGTFVRERIQRVAGSVSCLVISPVPWFPGNKIIRGRATNEIPLSEEQNGLQVLHPRFISVPRYLKCLDAFLYAACLAPQLARLRLRFDFDLIDAHFAYPDGVAAVLLSRLFQRPVVITLRGSIVRLRYYPLHRPQIQWALRRATRIIAVSEFLKDVTVKLGNEPGRIRVVPNGVDPARFHPIDRAQARSVLGLPSDRPTLLSVGGLNLGKGHQRVVEVLPQLLDRYPGLLYVIVGGERPGHTSRPLIERLVRRSHLEDHVLLAGERPHEEMALWYNSADLFCLATQSEGWSNALLEALACGTPVVSTRVGGNAEIVNHGEIGILVPPGEPAALAQAISQALTRRWNREALAAHGQQHSWDRAAQAVLEEWRAALADFRSHSRSGPKGDDRTAAPALGTCDVRSQPSS